MALPPLGRARVLPLGGMFATSQIADSPGGLALHAPVEPHTGPTAIGMQGRLYAAWASSAMDVRDAQRLRREVFFDEMGARAPEADAQDAIDVDRFDAFCDHLLVKVRAPAGSGDDQVVGTYRVLPPDAARRAGGYYSDTEFDMRSLHHLRNGTVELGRSCVHREWRRGGVIMMLWTALGTYMQQRELGTLIGCCSVALTDGGVTARRLWTDLSSSHLVDATSRVFPHVPYGVCEPRDAAPGLPVPALMKGYLRCGARLLGPPAHDAAFNTADFPMMLRLDELSASYRQHFMGAAT